MAIAHPQDAAKIKSQNRAKVPRGTPGSKQMDDVIATLTDGICAAESATLVLLLLGPKRGRTPVGTAASSLERERGISWGRGQHRGWGGVRKDTGS